MRAVDENDDDNKLTKRELFKTTTKLALASVALQTTSLLSSQEANADEVLSNFWEKVDLPLEPGVILLDIAFTDKDAQHGFLLGTRQTILETFDGGKTWDAKDLGADVIDDEMLDAFSIVGEPSEVAPKLAARYQGLVDRVQFAYDDDGGADEWAAVGDAIRAI